MELTVSLGLCMMHAVDKSSERQWRLLAEKCVWREAATGRRGVSRTLTPREQPQPDHRLLRKKGGRALPCTGSSPSLSHLPLQQGRSGSLLSGR